MNRLVEWLSSRRRMTAALVVGYLVFVTLSHERMQEIALWMQGHFSHRDWNTLVAGVSLRILLALGLWTAMRIRSHPQRLIAAFYGAGTVLLALIAFKTLLYLNIEVVHFPQYAILAILVFAIVRRYVETILWVTLAGMVDESYQYFYTKAHWGIYYDFNDVVLNQIGAAFGIVLLYIWVGPRQSVAERAPYSWRAMLNSSAIRVTGVLGAIGVALYSCGLLRVLRDEGAPAAAIVLRRVGPLTMFWTPTTWGKTYHEIQLHEWIPLAALILSLYVLLDLKSPRAADEPYVHRGLPENTKPSDLSPVTKSASGKARSSFPQE